ncbi:hypothetical protein [Algibacter sp. 2305UL17-15]|uniref:hypothetical protein n=1 Tax=Algibacter sp. 2305UL17-15 TaxID=3231268 RepID=UPI00345ACCC3
MTLPNRSGGSPGSYRYGFQGQEKDDEVKGEGNSVNYKYRMHDSRVGRFFAVDHLTLSYPYYTPYSFSGNKVIAFGEIEGLEEGWVINGEEVVKLEGPTEEVLNSFATQELAQAAQSIGMQTPSMMDSYMKFLYNNPSTPYTKPATVTCNCATCFINARPNTMLGGKYSIGGNIGVGIMEAPSVILPEIAFAKLGRAYQIWKSSKLATQTIKNANNLVHPEFINNADEAFDIYIAAQKKAVANVNNSGKTILGSFPDYIQMAKKNESSYFDIGATWDALAKNGQNVWNINKVFLDKVARQGDEIIITLGKNKEPGKYLKKEIKYLIEEKGYIWKNAEKTILTPK